MRRRATITLHWLSYLLLILLLAGGPLSPLVWAFGLSGLGLCLIALFNGLMNGPGPKLDGAARALHPWLSWMMYAALGGVAALGLWAQITGTATPPDATYFYLFSASSLHAIFHLWRHTALGDGALRRITPTVMHGML